MNSGVYLIMVGADSYVGSAADLEARFKGHVWRLKQGTHANTNLQTAWNALGVLSFEVLELVALPGLIAAEQRWMDALRPTTNVCRLAGRANGRLGVPMPPSARAKLSLAMRGNRNSTGRKLSEEHKRRISSAMKGVKKRPEAIRAAVLARWSEGG